MPKGKKHPFEVIHKLKTPGAGRVLFLRRARTATREVAWQWVERLERFGDEPALRLIESNLARLADDAPERAWFGDALRDARSALGAEAGQ